MPSYLARFGREVSSRTDLNVLVVRWSSWSLLPYCRDCDVVLTGQDLRWALLMTPLAHLTPAMASMPNPALAHPNDHSRAGLSREHLGRWSLLPGCVPGADPVAKRGVIRG